MKNIILLRTRIKNDEIGLKINFIFICFHVGQKLLEKKNKLEK